ncbi:methyltransferase family protein [Halanaeroarchaeum sulfurireducens]|uniref:Phospholipid methyltransferase n=1 Tax=Halanaeroarchaeum sulfurireducens TaxID=1604004 RepID=A0A0F7P8A3_9EURY|nr:isoprenylcysteine carboxylmethyltransferase family protein [Halanaeroarchaeum sulfurireducens]AKH96962.1 Phospholipid methyltransferase [Halanaeroarchaeum sulfurireducens]ALG81363.1 Phospholipid methyltransferase [Halanaeroarchaeum sulfurireducens]
MALDRTLLGAGKRILAVMAPYVVLVMGVNWVCLPALRVPPGPFGVTRILGAGGIAVGAAILWTSFRRLDTARRREELCTHGPYRFVRHPLYATWIWVLLPSGALLLGLPLLVTASPVMYLATRRAVTAEEATLRDEFGAEYEAYREATNALVPTIPRD